MGVRFDRAPDGTFYVLGQRRRTCPPPLNDGMGFFRAALERKVIVRARASSSTSTRASGAPGRASRFRSYVRFSFGPSMEQIEKALTRLEALIGEHAA